MKHRTATAALLLAAALSATAAPAGAQSVPPPGERVRVWTVDAFPASDVRLQDAARSGGGSWAVGARVAPQGRGESVSPVAFTRGGADRPWRELALPAGLEADTVAPDGSGGTWVTGSRRGGGVPIGHYRAGRWQVQDAPLPAHAVGGGFGGITTAGGPDDAWAVGSYQPDDLLTFYGVIEHWDGASWRQVPTPDLGTDYWTLSDVAATGPSDVWAAGSVGTPEGWPRPLLLHYDGRAWSRVAAPDLDARYGELTRLVVAGPGDVWAAGTENDASRTSYRPLVARFDGRAWTHQDTGIAGGRLSGLARTPGGVAVVGSVAVDGVSRPTGAQLTHRGWEPLDLPQGTAPGGRVPRGVVSVDGRLTVVGLDSAGTDADGRPLPPQPFSVTR
ncbi:hypothetical protein Kpho02_07920 [Kitasatospora phosalacinea]|uniref:Secreted protein n=1 Tax=Kitasatospora phosalacinea TaxID=2065 RepID=A0A9W6UZQ7_9ACTN|nr:hypothetical protein [Kitasatospora phosalacinea]GLW68493.1 hypothetical protein Kpho02_07920 [Kitasatospora phosalacinea]